MAKYIYSLVIEEWSEQDAKYERTEVRASFGTLKKALRYTRDLIEHMLHNPYADFEMISDSNLREFFNPIWAEIWLPDTGLHVRYTIVSNQLL